MVYDVGKPHYAFQIINSSNLFFSDEHFKFIRTLFLTERCIIISDKVLIYTASMFVGFARDLEAITQCCYGSCITSYFARTEIPKPQSFFPGGQTPLNRINLTRLHVEMIVHEFTSFKTIFFKISNKKYQTSLYLC